MILPRLGLALAAAALVGTAALAHHGWNWAEEQQSQVTGELQSVSMNPPHPKIEILAPDGALWQIELGNPNQTQRAGFTAETAEPGVAVHVLGHRAKDGTNLMKAVRITIDGTPYDFYPELIEPQG
ncbi:DUF6152 family protein [Cereibacter azotoformans]|uniref:Uncharacterized protein n=2 Tax=Cereibacter TaxID=1653176 RepID=A0A2T5JV37_9RHOB|nr:DUF6152 family protein [Cereibacter azotoformans]AXQ94742.1 50S ribosomal protein L2 [Cereibacter sphaeroides]MBO4170401.1 50S ribosomal protein L2 [Cereibacter azotoformans]PTR14040.1 hypothetical protein C8J28_11835 [Cereibacter azotoformans]UIJ30310.1 DUF6152 family protein [Cereibacter azotoformans]ULB10964.1 DUF6152 family protein [Cereibacter azotoformans]